jgi:hypothetical protein
MGLERMCGSRDARGWRWRSGSRPATPISRSSRGQSPRQPDIGRTTPPLQRPVASACQLRPLTARLRRTLVANATPRCVANERFRSQRHGSTLHHRAVNRMTPSDGRQEGAVVRRREPAPGRPVVSGRPLARRQSFPEAVVRRRRGDKTSRGDAMVPPGHRRPPGGAPVATGSARSRCRRGSPPAVVAPSATHRRADIDAMLAGSVNLPRMRPISDRIRGKFAELDVRGS